MSKIEGIIAEYELTYLAFRNDGTHSRPMKAVFNNEQSARAAMLDMVIKHEKEPLYKETSYRLTLSSGGKKIHEESSGVL